MYSIGVVFIANEQIQEVFIDLNSDPILTFLTLTRLTFHHVFSV
jgi:hypothetical protein